ENQFINRIRWARLDLAEAGDVIIASPGEWRITSKGKKRLKEELPKWKPEYEGHTQPVGGGRSGETTGHKGGEDDLTLDPTEALYKARANLLVKVEQDLLERLRKVEPSTFET